MVNLSKYNFGTLLAKAYSQKISCLIVSERFLTLTASYYKGNAFLLLYDISYRDSFDRLTYWIEAIG
jgi:GTPase SAR1 family protein